jgi:hypothetical protein
MKSQRRIKGILLILAGALVIPAATPAFATVTSVTITAPLASAKAYVQSGDSVDVHHTVVVGTTTGDLDRQVQIIGAIAVNPAAIAGPLSGTTLYLSTTATVPLAQAEGAYDVKVRARQRSGNGSGSWGAWQDSSTEIGAVIVDNTPPTSTILTPSDADTICLGTAVLITGTADDAVSGGVASGVASVTVSVDSTSLIVTGTTSWSAEWTPTAVGTYTITSVATDNAGNVQSTPASIIVEVVECQACPWVGETAWAAGTRYVAQGNWATYTAYVAGSTVTLYAGQDMDAGTVDFSSPADGLVTITITLNAGWRFLDAPENVKIQDYATAPSGNPAPGLFAWKDYATGSAFAIEVPVNNFYGVHVDVERQDCE